MLIMIPNKKQKKFLISTCVKKKNQFYYVYVALLLCQGMHFWYWQYQTSSYGIIYFLFLPFFTMTTRNRQIQNFTSNFGPQHPAAHGVSRSILEMNGEVVQRAEPHIGLLQCGMKQLTLSWLLCRQLCLAWSPSTVEVPQRVMNTGLRGG